MPSAVKDVTIFISGVDFYILHQVQDSTTNRRFDLTQKYVRDVAVEIDRVLGENGALVTHDSTIGLDVTREDNTGKYEESEIVFDKSKPGDRPDFPGFIYKKLPEPVR
jgi:hypothetical protein